MKSGRIGSELVLSSVEVASKWKMRVDTTEWSVAISRLLVTWTFVAASSVPSSTISSSHLRCSSSSWSLYRTEQHGRIHIA